MQDNNVNGYADFYLLAVPKANIEAYKTQATEFGKIALEKGALAYREFMADDLESEGGVAYDAIVPVKEGEVLTTAVAEFKSREHRDEVMANVMEDPRVKKMIHEELAEMSRMVYGGFKTFVQP